MSKVSECSNCGAVLVIPQGKYIAIIKGLTISASSMGALEELVDQFGLDADAMEKISNKAESLQRLLTKNHPQLLTKETSIENGSPESGCWYSGYYVALLDVLRLMNAELEDTISVDRPIEDTNKGGI